MEFQFLIVFFLFQGIPQNAAQRSPLSRTLLQGGQDGEAVGHQPRRGLLRRGAVVVLSTKGVKIFEEKSQTWKVEKL